MNYSRFTTWQEKWTRITGLASRGKRLLMAPLVMAAVVAGVFIQEMAFPRLATSDENNQQKSPAYSVTVYPISLQGHPDLNVAEVIALFLEKGGVQEIVIADTEFQPGESSDCSRTAEQFQTFLSQNPLRTDYAIYGEFFGTPQKGVDEVRTFLVKKNGNNAWYDRQTPADTEFQRVKPNNPMTCCVLMIDRLRTQLKMDDPYRSNAPKGKIAQLWEEKSSIPPESVRVAMKERLEQMKKSAPKSTLTIYSVRIGQKANPNHAQHLAEEINKEGLIATQVHDKEINLAVPGNSNEQRVLWDMARMFQDYVQKNPPKTEYALYADYILSESHPRIGGVHFVVCDQKGAWVIVDFQNEYQDDFKKIDPQSDDGCDRLVVERLKHFLK